MPRLNPLRCRAFPKARSKMLIYVPGDVFKTDCGIIAHGCNCQGGYGSGVAYYMAKTYPNARNCYLEKHHSEGWNLGDVQFVLQHDNKFVANCATQFGYLPRGICHADYPAIRTCLEKVRDFAVSKDLSVAMPKIGAGLAGGDWATIEEIVEEVFEHWTVKVYYL